MESKLKHLDMIQGVINRMAGNSFSLKNWNIVIVSAIFALIARGNKPYFVYIAYLPAFAFWLLDGYFLRQERLYRKLYDRVRELDTDRIDFSMNTSDFQTEVNSWLCTCLSSTLLIFHGSVVITIVVVMLIILKN